MNEKNLDYLKNSLKYLGFGDKLNDVLEKAIRQELPKFTISLNNSIAPPGSSKDNLSERDFIRYDLSFSKSKDSDMYFLNHYQAKLQKPHTPEREHTFTLNNGNWTTAKEAYNLLSGRAVNKDISQKENSAEKANVWIKLNLDVKDAHGNYPVRYFYQNYGYDLDKSLSKYPLTDLNDLEKKTGLVNSLRKGDLASAELLLNGKKTAVFIAANPEMKGVEISDKKLHPVKDYHVWPELTKGKNLVQEAIESANEKVALQKGETNTPSGTSAKPWKQEKGDNESKSTGRKV